MPTNNGGAISVHFFVRHACSNSSLAKGMNERSRTRDDNGGAALFHINVSH